MADRMFGLETEYAITGILGDRVVDRKDLADRLLDVAEKHLPHLPDTHGSGIFLANGSRLYVDQGAHPELSTPECTNPWDAVRYVKAGEKIMDAILSRLGSEVGTGTEISCFLCNVDYVKQVTWGCHESFLHRCDPTVLPKHIIPHLVSRTVYTGAGGFNPFSGGIHFTLSPRAAHIGETISSGSTAHRPIFHTKDESLSSRGYHRLHIICGESLCSEWAAWLKIGATALVVALAEAGLEPGCGVELGSPVTALRSVAADTCCRSTFPLSDGSTADALQIQRHYLALAESHIGDSFMPPWAEAVCVRWRQILNLLEDRSEKIRALLDWPMKEALFEQHTRKCGMEWEALGCWNYVMGRLEAASGRLRRCCCFNPDSMIGPNSPILEEIARLTPYIRANGLRWDGLETFLRLKRELLEIDMRFGQLGGQGVYRALEDAGLTAHLDGIDNIEHAVSNPPAEGRARIRGDFVRRFAGRRDVYRCDWSGIMDLQKKCFLDLSDPFAAEERWNSPEEPPSVQPDSAGRFRRGV